eukprot:m.276078 g.276078  ORF g.276078 m.276078 type:complete len:211 (-) comp122196_c0_seq1:487-1119(-)
MQVAYEIRSSSGLGLGVFAKSRIECGQLIWDFDKALDANELRVFKTEEELKDHLAHLSQEDLTYFLEHAYFDASAKDFGCIFTILGFPGGVFNHSPLRQNICLGKCILDGANKDSSGAGPVATIKPRCSYATKDIEAGTELFDNYNSYAKEPEWYMKLIDSNNIDESYMDTETAAPVPPSAWSAILKATHQHKRTEFALDAEPLVSPKLK